MKSKLIVIFGALSLGWCAATWAGSACAIPANKLTDAKCQSIGGGMYTCSPPTLTPACNPGGSTKCFVKTDNYTVPAYDNTGCGDGMSCHATATTTILNTGVAEDSNMTCTTSTQETP